VTASCPAALGSSLPPALPTHRRWAEACLRGAPTAPLHRPQLHGEPTLLLHEEQAVRGNSWFRQLDGELQRAVLAACSVRRVRSGAVLLRGNSPAQAWYGLAQGAVRISTPLDSGRRLTLSLLRPGQWFGDAAVFDSQPQVEAQACTDATLLWMPRTTLLSLMEQHRGLGMALAQLNCHRTRLLTAQLTAAVSMSLRQRLAHLLLHMSRRFGEPHAKGVRLWLKLSQRDLSDMLGVCRQRVNVCLKQMEREHMLATAQGHLLLQTEALSAMAANSAG
jgi:CRP/FNR family cyclic AMP-dependent transcriptional regulator